MSGLAVPPGFRGAFRVDAGAREAAATASGILCALPRAVAVPRDTADVSVLVRWAAATATPLVARGAGTGMPGGNVGGGVALDLMTTLARVHHVDAARAVALVEPGVTQAALNAACAPLSLAFPVDPSSGGRCTLGGMIANNSAGAHSVRYGATRAWVHALDVVLADGSRARAERGRRPESTALLRILERVDAALRPRADWIREQWPRVRKNSSGYALREYLESGDAVDLLVGSEGTLALTVGAEIHLAPVPAARGLAVLEFTDLAAAGAAVETVLFLGPAACEILDRTFLEMVRGGGKSSYPLRPALEALLLVEFEGTSTAEVEHALGELRRVTAGLASGIAVTADPAGQARLWAVRHAASPLIATRADGRVSMQFIEDGVVPVARLADYVRLLRRVLSRYGLPAVIFGHAGDGNLHVNPLVDVGAPGWRATVEAVLYEVAAGVAELGGTLAGEHGDGRLRAPLLETIWGPEMVGLFCEVKAAWDPQGILNPGVILPLPGQRPLDALGIDSLPPAPHDLPAPG